MPRFAIDLVIYEIEPSGWPKAIEGARQVKFATTNVDLLFRQATICQDHIEETICDRPETNWRFPYHDPNYGKKTEEYGYA